MLGRKQQIEILAKKHGISLQNIEISEKGISISKIVPISQQISKYNLLIALMDKYEIPYTMQYSKPILGKSEYKIPIIRFTNDYWVEEMSVKEINEKIEESITDIDKILSCFKDLPEEYAQGINIYGSGNFITENGDIEPGDFTGKLFIMSFNKKYNYEIVLDIEPSYLIPQEKEQLKGENFTLNKCMSKISKYFNTYITYVEKD